MHLSDYLGMKLTDIKNENGSIILEFNDGPSLVFENVSENGIAFHKCETISDVEKKKTEKEIAFNKANRKK